MRLVFAGTPAFAEQALAALGKAGHEVALVLTQPDRPAGRGQRLVESPVKRLALRDGLAVYQPESLRSLDALQRVESVRPDALVVAAYGLILPPAFLELGRFGALNIHASLLPRWRGAAPIQRALLAGDAKTGVSIMRMNAGLDTGPVLAQRELRILSTDDAGSLHDKLAALGAGLMIEALQELAAGRARAIAQPETGVTYARKIEKQDATLDWTRPAIELERAVRAFRPSPGAVTSYQGESLKIWSARIESRSGVPGTVLGADRSLVVACGVDALEIAEVQRPGGRRMSAAEFLRGRSVVAGTRFE